MDSSSPGPRRRAVLGGIGTLILGAIPFATTSRPAVAKSNRTSFKGRVERARASQTDLIRRDEHCCVDAGRLSSIGVPPGGQVRIRRDHGECALYTVSETSSEKPDNVVRMGKSGRSRLGTGETFKATVDASVVHPTYTDEEAASNSEFVERLDDDGDNAGLVACAPHGGWIEWRTDRQAERVASALGAGRASSWRCKGWNEGGGAFRRWHITSTDIDPASFPLLGSIADRGFERAVSFHGYGGSDVLVGGAAPERFKADVAASIEDALAGTSTAVKVVSDGPYAGTSPRNFVNWLTDGGCNGVQIEQPFEVRSNHWRAVADAVADAYRPLL